jgi:hypothetical protein
MSDTSDNETPAMPPLTVAKVEPWGWAVVSEDVRAQLTEKQAQDIIMAVLAVTNMLEAPSDQARVPDDHFTLRFTAVAFPRFSSSTNSIC